MPHGYDEAWATGGMDPQVYIHHEPPVLGPSTTHGEVGGAPKVLPPAPGHSSDHVQQQVLLNQGGLLSMSSISPQTSPPPPIQQAESVGGETARSVDSVQLPQRPTRRHVIRPNHVPALDFSRLNHQLDEEEEEELEQGEEQDADARAEAEWLRHAAAGGEMLLDDGHDVRELMEALERHREDCARAGKFEEAEMAARRLAMLQQHEDHLLQREEEELEARMASDGGPPLAHAGANLHGLGHPRMEGTLSDAEDGREDEAGRYVQGANVSPRLAGRRPGEPRDLSEALARWESGSEPEETGAVGGCHSAR